MMNFIIRLVYGIIKTSISCLSCLALFTATSHYSLFLWIGKPSYKSSLLAHDILFLMKFIFISSRYIDILFRIQHLAIYFNQSSLLKQIIRTYRVGIVVLFSRLIVSVIVMLRLLLKLRNDRLSIQALIMPLTDG